MPFQPEEIAAKQFLVRARGYDRDEVAAFLRAVAADYRAALEAATASAPTAEDRGEAVAEDAGEDAGVPAQQSSVVGDRWAGFLAERRAADLLVRLNRRLEEVAARERRVAEAEQRLALQLQAARDALRRAHVPVPAPQPPTVVASA